MTFNLTEAQEERFFFLQKRKLDELLGSSRFSFEMIRFPDSSRLLGEIKRVADLKDGFEVQEMFQLLNRVVEFASGQDKGCFLVLPGLSPRSGFVYTQYPIIKAKPQCLLLFLELIRDRGIPMDYVALVLDDLKHGIVLDVYAGDPKIHQTDREICKITSW